MREVLKFSGSARGGLWKCCNWFADNATLTAKTSSPLHTRVSRIIFIKSISFPRHVTGPCARVNKLQPRTSLSRAERFYRLERLSCLARCTYTREDSISYDNSGFEREFEPWTCVEIRN